MMNLLKRFIPAVVLLASILPRAGYTTPYDRDRELLAERERLAAYYEDQKNYAAAIASILPWARAGDAETQMVVGSFMLEWLEDPKALEKPTYSRDDALAWWYAGALNGSKQAARVFSGAYKQGRLGLDPSSESARCWQEAEAGRRTVRECVPGDTRAPTVPASVLNASIEDLTPRTWQDRAWRLVGQGQLAEALKLCISRARSGDAFAQYMAGWITPDLAAQASGTPASKDLEAGIGWLRAAAQGGFDPAAELLADAYLHGQHGLPKHSELAACWSEVATSKAYEIQFIPRSTEAFEAFRAMLAARKAKENHE